MAGGWAKDGAVSEQIEASINDELARLKARRAPVGESAVLRIASLLPSRPWQSHLPTSVRAEASEAPAVASRPTIKSVRIMG